MKNSIEGPDCTEICNGDCCSIKIDVPKVLAKEYIKRGYAEEGDFIRSNIFTFHLRFDDEKGKCFLFNSEINGCSVHNSGIKPPQCWIYPTNFSNPEGNDISCKKASGWKIINQTNVSDAEKLLKMYNFLCQLEARKETRKVFSRVGANFTTDSSNKVAKLKSKIMSLAPSQIGGFKDSWSFFDVLSAEGLSLQLKKFCITHNKKCEYLPDNFLECKKVCHTIADKLVVFLQNNIYSYINNFGPSPNGIYSFIDLFNFNKNKDREI
jgi:hypothetical protein